MFVRIRFLVHGARRISKELFHVASNEEQILNMDLRDERDPNHLDDPPNPPNRCKKFRDPTFNYLDCPIVLK